MHFKVYSWIFLATLRNIVKHRDAQINATKFRNRFFHHYRFLKSKQTGFTEIFTVSWCCEEKNKKEVNLLLGLRFAIEKGSNKLHCIWDRVIYSRSTQWHSYQRVLPRALGLPAISNWRSPGSAPVHQIWWGIFFRRNFQNFRRLCGLIYDDTVPGNSSRSRLNTNFVEITRRTCRIAAYIWCKFTLLNFHR